MKILFKNPKILLTITIVSFFLNGCSTSNSNIKEAANINNKTVTNIDLSSSMDNSNENKDVSSTNANDSVSNAEDKKTVTDNNSSNDKQIVKSSSEENKSVQSEAASNVSSGLLLGLSNDAKSDDKTLPINFHPNTYRTLWIQNINNKITYAEKKGEIIAPYKDTFYKLGNTKFTMSKPSDIKYKSNSDSFYLKYRYYYDFTNIVSHLADKPIQELFTPETFRKKYLHEKGDYMGEPFKFAADYLMYAGNNYACIKNNYYDTGGGSYSGGSEDIKLYDLTNLTDLNSMENCISLSNLLDENEKKKLEGYADQYNKPKVESNLMTIEYKVDTDNLLLKRNTGRWQALVPLYRLARHNGNGSYGKIVDEYLDTDIKLPKSITSYDNLCIDFETIKKKYPDAKDAVSSPNNNLLAVLTPSKLLLFTNPQNGIDTPSLSIDVDSTESIVLNQWAVGEYVDKWNRLID